MNGGSNSDGGTTTSSSGMEGLLRHRHGSSETTCSSTASSHVSHQRQSPFVCMFQTATLPTLIMERIANCLSSMEVLRLSVTCHILQQKLLCEWQGWPCDTCQQPLFASFLPSLDMIPALDEDAVTVDDNEGSIDSMEISHPQSNIASSSASASSSDPTHQVSSQTSSDNPQKRQRLMLPLPPLRDLPKVGGCHLCLGRRTCPGCTERCIECGITACEEGHRSFDGEMCVNVVCTDDFQPLTVPHLQHHHRQHHARATCRGCLNKCRACEDAYCNTCSSISLCRYCGNSECAYCQDQCFDEAYGFGGNINSND